MSGLEGDYDETDQFFSFWNAVDSASFTHAGCDCSLRDLEESHGQGCCTEGPGWALTRNAACLGLMSGGMRCHRPVEVGVPFCYFHFQRAERWFIQRMESKLDRLARERIEYGQQIWMIDRLENDVVRDAQSALARANAKVYFLGIDDEVVKIGFSINVDARVSQIRHGSSLAPDGYDRKRAQLIGTTEGGQSVESTLHQVLRPHRIVGEWFRLHDDVRAVINFLTTGEGEEAANAVFVAAVRRPWWIDEGYPTEAEAVAHMEGAAS